MLNREKHQLIMGRVLKDIYSDISIAPLLGFKGGTACYFFYGLPRFSADLDFDLLTVSEKNIRSVYKKIIAILRVYGEIKQQRVKHQTIFAILSYGGDDRNIKVEISTRKLYENIKNFYEMKEYLGISLPTAKKDYTFASKLAALTTRPEIASRDIYDIYYFAKNNWEISEEAIKARTGKSVKDYLGDCVALIEKIKESQILSGLGELISEKEKNWVKNNLKIETVFLLKNYRSVLK